MLHFRDDVRNCFTEMKKSTQLLGRLGFGIEFVELFGHALAVPVALSLFLRIYLLFIVSYIPRDSCMCVAVVEKQLHALLL